MADIQVIIGRLSQHSFVIKGWSVTLVSVMFAIIASQDKRSWGMTLFALGSTLSFWALDAYYLRRERLFRHLYAAVARRLTRGGEAPDVEPFDMDVSRYADRVKGFVATLFTGNVVAIPAMLSTMIVVYSLVSF